MRSISFRVLAACLLSFLIADPAYADWRVAKSPHFTVYSSESEADLRRETLQLEQYDAMFRKLFNVQESIPVTIFMVGDTGEVQDLLGAGREGVAGFYTATAQRAIAVVPKKIGYYVKGFNPKVVLLHEYAHHMLLSNTGTFMPGWAQEGLAEMFATAKLNDDGSVIIGDENDARGYAVLGAHRWSVERMLRSDFDPPKHKDEAIEKYSRGWALVHYLWLSGERPGQYAKFISELNKTIDPVHSGKVAFGDLGELDRELDRYVRRSRFNVSSLAADQLDPRPEVEIRDLSPAEADILPYQIISARGVDRARALKVVSRAEQVAARYPNDVAVNIEMAEAYYDAADYKQSAASADRVLALDRDNVLALVYKGRTLMRQAMADRDPAKAVEARRWILKANRAAPNNPLPFVVYYDSFVAMGEVPTQDAVQGLYRAVILVPQDSGVRVRAAIALLREGDIKAAERTLAPVAFAAEGVGENRALDLIKEISTKANVKSLLEKAHELKLDLENEFIEKPKDSDEEMAMGFAVKHAR